MKPQGHSNVLDEMSWEIWAFRMNGFKRNLVVMFPTREERKTDNPLQDHHTVFFTDGSKMVYGVNAKVFGISIGCRSKILKICFRFVTFRSLYYGRYKNKNSLQKSPPSMPL